MATNIQKEALELFGTPTGDGGLATFDPESYSKTIGLPGTEDISGPSPFAAIATRESRTYTPPTRSTFTGAEQEVNFGESAFLSDINIAAPSPDDFETINDVPGFENVSKEAIKSLGLLGMTPTSLTKTAQNLTSLNTEGIANTAINIATRGTPIAGVLGIAEKAFSGAFQRGISLGNPQQIAQLAILANNMSNISIENLLSGTVKGIEELPETIQSNIEAFFTGLSDFIENPLETLENFGELAGTYAHYGTFNPTINDYNVNGITQTFITDQYGNVVTTPGFAKAIMGIANMGTIATALNVFGELVAGESAAEKAERQMENMAVAAELPSFAGKVTTSLGTVDFGITSVPSGLADRGRAEVDFTDVISIDLSQIPGAGVGGINIDMAEFGRTGVIDGAVIGNTDTFIGFEEEQIAEEIAAYAEAAKNSPEGQAAAAFSAAVNEVTEQQYAELDKDVPDVYVEGLPTHANAAAQVRSEIEEKISLGKIVNGISLVEHFAAKGVTLDPKAAGMAFTAAKQKMSAREAAQYAETLQGLSVFGQLDPLSLPPEYLDYIMDRQDSISKSIGEEYNAVGIGPPSISTIGIANAVMSITDHITYQPHLDTVKGEMDKSITKVVLDFMEKYDVEPEKAIEIAQLETRQLMMDPHGPAMGGLSLTRGELEAMGLDPDAYGAYNFGVPGPSLTNDPSFGEFGGGPTGSDPDMDYSDVDPDTSIEDDPTESGEGAATGFGDVGAAGNEGTDGPEDDGGWGGFW